MGEGTMVEENSLVGRKQEQTQTGRQPSAAQPQFVFVLKNSVSRLL